MLNELDINEEQLPQLYPSCTPIGNIRRMTSNETGLSEKTIVITGALDQAASAIGAGNIKKGIITETTGAALAVVATIENPIYDPQRRIPCHHHAVDNLYYLMPWSQTAGMVLRWYRDQFGILEKQVGNLMNIEAYDLLGIEASKVPPGSNGLVILPHLSGAACPEFDPNARGVVFGLTLKHSRGHVIRAIMESVAYMLKENLNLLEELGVDINEIQSLGGASRSSLWVKIKADVLQKCIYTLKQEQAACLGVAMIAGVASKQFQSLEKATETLVLVKDKIEPNPANREIYDTLYDVYIKLYENLKLLFPVVNKF